MDSVSRTRTTAENKSRADQSGAGQSGAGQSGAGGSGAAAASLLRWGVVAGPFYLALGLAQAFLREGFDLARHPLSALALGPGGWVQTANFVVTGLMVVAAAIGFARVLRPQSRAAAWFLGLFGVGMILAAVFPADPMDGFPVGTPPGMPESISTTGLLHFIMGALSFLSLGIAGLVTAAAMRRRGEPAVAVFSLACGLAVLLGFFAGPALTSSASPVIGIWIAVVVGWVWLAVMCVKLIPPSAGTSSSRAHTAVPPRP